MSPSLHWLDLGHPAYFVGAGSVLGLALLRTLLPLAKGQIDRRTTADWAWGLIILLMLLAGRWPTLVSPHELDADESFLFAGAHTLYLDPVFWRSVDGTTTGPFNFIALWPTGLLFGWDSYSGLHLTALLLVAATLFMVHLSLTRLFGRTVGRIATIGPLGLEALTNSFDLLHYSSELLSVALLAAATLLGVRRWQEGGSTAGNFLAGVALGCVPFAKPQAAPVAAIFGLVWFVLEGRCARDTGGKKLIYLLTGGLLPLLGIMVQLTFSGLWVEAHFSYFLSNLYYARTGPTIMSDIWRVLLETAISHDSLLHLWLVATLIVLLALLRFPVVPGREPRALALTSGAACLLSILVIVAPGRPFLHYCQLLVAPLTLFLGAMIAGYLHDRSSVSPRQAVWLIGCTLLILLPMVGQRALVPNLILGPLHDRVIIRYSPLTRLVQPLLRPGDTIQVWGWANHINVETGTPFPTRDATIDRALTPGPYQAYYYLRYLHDFVTRMPEFFFDVISDHSLIRGEQNKHENIHPVLAQIIAKHYVLVAENHGARLYQRKDLVGRP